MTIEWRNELDGRLAILVTIAPEAADADGVPVQCVPGLSGGAPDTRAGALAGHTVMHLHRGVTPGSYDGWAENLFAPGQPAVFHWSRRVALIPFRHDDAS